MRDGTPAASACGSLRVVLKPAGWGCHDMYTPSLTVFLWPGRTFSALTEPAPSARHAGSTSGPRSSASENVKAGTQRPPPSDAGSCGGNNDAAAGVACGGSEATGGPSPYGARPAADGEGDVGGDAALRAASERGRGEAAGVAAGVLALEGSAGRRGMRGLPGSYSGSPAGSACSGVPGAPARSGEPADADV
jgi:hypothetical protein